MIGKLLCRIGRHDRETVAEFSDGSWRKECQRDGCTWYDYHEETELM